MEARAGWSGVLGTWRMELSISRRGAISAAAAAAAAAADSAGDGDWSARMRCWEESK